MKVARAIAARSYDYWHDRWETPHNGLVCNSCHEFFRTATELIAHPCWNRNQERHLQRNIREEVAAKAARRYAIELEDAMPTTSKPTQPSLF